MVLYTFSFICRLCSIHLHCITILHLFVIVSDSITLPAFPSISVLPFLFDFANGDIVTFMVILAHSLCAFLGLANDVSRFLCIVSVEIIREGARVSTPLSIRILYYAVSSARIGMFPRQNSSQFLVTLSNVLKPIESLEWRSVLNNIGLWRMNSVQHFAFPEIE
jgi:hypothetical protein